MNASTYTSTDNGTKWQKPAYDPLLFKWSQSADGLGAPKLIPGPGYSSIDVFNEYPWTLSQREARQHIPKAIITEYRQTQSSELRGFLYSIRGVISDLTVAPTVASSSFAAFGQNKKTAIIASGQQTAPGGSNPIIEGLQSTVKKANTLSTTAVDKLKDFYNKIGSSASVMDPYSGLYAVENTGFEYHLPYYTGTNMMKVGNTWGATSTQIAQGVSKVAGGIGSFFSGAKKQSTTGTGEGDRPQTEQEGKRDLMKMFGGAMDVIGGTRDILYGTGAGVTKKEELKSYQGSDAAESVEISFYLYNTVENEDITQLQRNWEFCYLLTYQNLPNRKGINYLDAPCLYKIDVPGYKNLPLAYLASLSITNIGNTRLVDLKSGEVKGGDNGGLYVKLMPEAYKISLSFTSVLTNARNLFLNNADPAQNVTVTVGETR
jgi:hypothetical protein